MGGFDLCSIEDVAEPTPELARPRRFYLMSYFYQFFALRGRSNMSSVSLDVW